MDLIPATARSAARRFYTIWIPLLLCLLFSATLCNADPPPTDDVSATVSTVIDGDTVVLSDPVNGVREVRLVGTQAPKLPLNRPNFKKWPLADEAEQRVAELSIDRRFRLQFTGRDLDRHGRLLAHLFRDDGLWLQGAMVQEGLARVYTFADNRAYAEDLLKLERTARAEGRGIWSHPFYAIRTPAEAQYDVGTFQVVEGQIVSATRAGRWAYLNFGPNWRTDFTISVNVKDMPLFETAGLRLTQLSGKSIRVRGWVESRNGPMITIDHPEPLELIAP